MERIVSEKHPKAVLLENVEGLINHDMSDKTKKMGHTLETMLTHLDKLGYQVEWAYLNSHYFGVRKKRNVST